MSVWEAVSGRGSLLIDVGFLVVFGVVQVLAVRSIDVTKIPADPDGKNGDAMRSAATGALTVVGILLPVMLLTLQLRAGTGGSTTIATAAVVDVVAASLWLLISATCGLCVIFVSVYRGHGFNVLTRHDLTIGFGLQLLFLLTGIFRAVWAVTSIASALINQT